MLEIDMPFLSYWLCYFLCRWSDSGCTCAFRCPERLSTDRNDSLCLPLNVSLTSTQVDGRYCPVLSLSWRTTTSPPLQSSGPSPQHYWPRFSLWSLSASATLSLLPQHESMSMALATSILIVVWQMLTDLSRVRKYRRLKPFLFITVVIMVNVYSTLNFRGPPTPPTPLFFSLVSDQPVCCFDQAEAQLAPLVQIPMVSFSSIQSSWGANLSDSLYESSLYA